MLGHGRSDQQEEQARRSLVDRVVLNSGRMPAENDDRMVDQANQAVARMGQRDPVANSRAVELFAFMERRSRVLRPSGWLASSGIWLTSSLRTASRSALFKDKLIVAAESSGPTTGFEFFIGSS